MPDPTAAAAAPRGEVGDGLPLLVSATGLFALSAPTAVQVFWLLVVGGATAARAVAARRPGASGPPAR